MTSFVAQLVIFFFTVDLCIVGEYVINFLVSFIALFFEVACRVAWRCVIIIVVHF